MIVDPQLYIAFGISGAVQHTSGLGRPQHVISINTDPHCPMMQLADLAVVADANAVLDELLAPARSRRWLRPTSTWSIVGAGPAGSCAAIEAARGGLRTLLLERGPFPGSKNMYGGVIYPRILDDLIPEWWNEAPIQRWVTRRSTMILTDTQALSVDFRNDGWGAPPYNGATAYRPDFDRWLADHAVAAGATLLCDTTVTGLLREPTRRSRSAVTGVRTDRPDGDVTAHDGDRLRRRQQLRRQGGRAVRNAQRQELHARRQRDAGTPKDVIDERFGVRGREGVDIEIIGCTGGINGGGFVYTNLDTIAVGVVLKLTKLAAQQDAARRHHRGDEATLGDRSAGRRRRAEGVLRAPDPRGRPVDDAGDDRPRTAGRRRRRRAVPCGRHLAGGCQLRDGQRHVRRTDRGRGNRRRRRQPARPRRIRPPAQRHVRAAGSPQAAPSARAGAQRPCAAHVPVDDHGDRRANVPRRQPRRQAGTSTIVREERKRAGVHRRNLFSDSRDAFRSFG